MAAVYQVVAVRDRAANAFSMPQFYVSTEVARRNFGQLVNDVKEGNNVVNQHPEDFDMFLLGTYDDETGAFNQVGPPRQIAIGKDLVRPVR